MLLALNVNNSRTGIAVYDGDALRVHWRVVTENRTADQLRILITSLLHDEGLVAADITGCCVASVVPQYNADVRSVCRDGFGVEPVMVGPGVKSGLDILVDNPREVGADRIVTVVGALAEHDGPLIVVDLGTATTFDAVTAKAEYLGGAIVPGIGLASDALFERCALLPRVEIITPPNVIGKDTISHIRAGLTYGYADMVDGLVVRMKREMGTEAKVVATGGQAHIIADVAQHIDVYDPLLTLKGIKAVFDKNSGAAS